MIGVFFQILLELDYNNVLRKSANFSAETCRKYDHNIDPCRCRQYDPRDANDTLFGLYLRNFNDAIEKFQVWQKTPKLPSILFKI
jgi:hypothetical protein